MTDNLAIKALSIKKKGKLTPLETQQIADLQKAYGRHNVLSAIRFAKFASISAVARMLLQHCGVRPILPPSLQGIIPDRASAEKMLTPDKFQVACRLGKATLQIEHEVDEATRVLSSFLGSKLGQTEISKTVQSLIRGAVRKFGVSLAKRGIDVIPVGAKLSEEQFLKLYRDWLENASIKNWVVLESIVAELGNSSEAGNWAIPEPMPIRIGKYFHAKANRNMTREEANKVWLLIREHKVEKVIHAMSCVPAAGFSVHKLERLLTPKELWEYYELDTEERIETLFRNRLGRISTKEELNSILSFLEATKTNLEDFIEIAYRIKPIELSSIDTIKRCLDDLIMRREDENFEDDMKNELVSEIAENPVSIHETDGYDYSVLDENSLTSDDFLDDYDLDELE